MPSKAPGLHQTRTLRACNFLLGAALALSASAATAEYHVRDGVLTHRESGEELVAFGVNYSVPFAHAHRRMAQLGIDHRGAIDADVYHMTRLGMDGYRIHTWDIEISDHEGNLLQNEHLDAFDYLLARLKERGFRAIITPLFLNDNGFPDGATPTPGFAGLYDKEEMDTNEEFIEAQARFLGQFVAHTNPHTGLRYLEDPMMIGFELSNEPRHTGEPEQTIAYIRTLVSAVRETGCVKPLFYNMSQNPYRREQYYAAGVDGWAFQWYPAGLGGATPNRLNLLPMLDDYGMFFGDDEEFRAGARIVYEFDVSNVDATHLYAQMARQFRARGFQFATQFAYDALALSDCNTEYPVHYLNLAYTPGKAIGFKIAGRVFRETPLGEPMGSYPANLTDGPLRIHPERDLVEWLGGEAFLHSNTTDSVPPSAEELALVAGRGSSPLVDYPGEGAYFLDRIGDGIWRLEVMPDVIHVRSPYEYRPDGIPSGIIIHRTHPMGVHLPGLDGDFAVLPVVAPDGVETSTHADEGRFNVSPGVYLLVHGELEVEPDPDLDLGRFRLGEFHAPEPNHGGLCYVSHDPPSEAVRGRPLVLDARIALAEEPATVLLEWNGSERHAMRRVGPYDYTVDIPAASITGGHAEYRLLIEDSGGNRRAAENADSFRVEVNDPEEPLLLCRGGGSAWPYFSHMTDWKLVEPEEEGDAEEEEEDRWGVRRIELDNGEWAFAMNTKERALAWEPKRAEFGYDISDRLRWREGSFERLAVRGRILQDRQIPVEVILRTRDGVRWATSLSFDDTVRTVQARLANFRPTYGVRLASNPRFLSPVIDAPQPSGPLNWEEVESIWFALGPGMPEEYLETENGFAFVSAWLVRE